MRAALATAVAAVLSLLGACLGTSAPAAPVRWFDASPAPLPALGRAAAFPAPLVTAGAAVRQEFVLRIGARELAIDELHRWSAPPDRLVAAAVERALFGPGAGSQGTGTFTLRVVRFELDLTGPPRALVELHALLPAGLRVCTGDAAAGGTGPEALAEAMARALLQAVAALRSALLPD